MLLIRKLWLIAWRRKYSWCCWLLCKKNTSSMKISPPTHLKNDLNINILLVWNYQKASPQFFNNNCSFQGKTSWMLSQRLVMTFKAPPDVVTRTKVGRREPNTRNRRRYGRCRNTGKDTSENTDDAPFFLSIMDINKCFFNVKLSNIWKKV